MFRKTLLWILVALVTGSALLTGLSSAPAAAQQGEIAQPNTYLFMRTGPSENFEVTTTLAPGTDLILEARDSTTHWVLVHTADNGLRGWVSTCCLIRDANVVLYHLPVSTELTTGTGPAAPPAGDTEPAAPVAGGNTATTTVNLNMREGPSMDDEVITLLLRGTTLILEERSADRYWWRARTADGTGEGWVSTCCLAYDNPGDASVASALSTDTDLPAYAPTSEREAELINKLTAAPIVPGISGRVGQIFATGQALGNRPDVFSKVGDCMSEFHAFFLPFGVGEYTLGGYANLQPTIDFFTQTSPRYGSTNSFVNESMAAKGGFSTPSVLDPLWAKPDHCEPGETPLMCEYRLIQPSVAIILFGAVDVHYLPPADFGGYLRQIVEYSINRGVIPVLNTIPADRNYMWMPLLELNSVILDIGNEYDIPVINLWRATQPLPDGGMETEDYLHLSYNGSRWISFNGDETIWGYPMRNLVTLQMLDALRRNVLQ